MIDAVDDRSLCIAIVGGTGPEGRGLATRLARAGFAVTIGSRSADRAAEAAQELSSRVERPIGSGSNADAIVDADIVVLTIPFAGIDDTLPALQDQLRSRIVVSAIAPVEFREGRPVALRVEEGSAAQHVAALAPEARVVAAFQTLDARLLQDPDAEIDTDVIVCSDDQDARRLVVALARAIPGVRGLSGGRLAASRYVEECTALLITLNRIYKTHTGIRFTGIDR